MALRQPRWLQTAGAEITYTLHGAVFADRVRNTDLIAKHNGGTMTPRVVEGGGVGDSSVTFDVEAPGFVYSDAVDARKHPWLGS